MDNEGLLAWGEYEVERAREVLERAKAHTGELREIVRREKEELAEMAKYITYIEKFRVPRKVWMAALSTDARSAQVEEAKELLEETLRVECEEEEQKECVKAHLKKLGVPAIVYKMATSLEELLVMISDKKAFLKRNGYSEEELEP